MILLAVDPSSTKTGWALLDNGGGAIELITAGIDKHLGSSEEIEDRYLDITAQARSRVLWARDQGATAAVVEIPSQRPFSKQAPAGLSNYGVAVGLWLARLDDNFDTIVRVRPERWVRDGGGEKKYQRAKLMTTLGLYKGQDGQRKEKGMMVPSHFEKGDSGNDKSDALALGCWAMRRI